ncbi:Alkylated DNA repair dioxygenase AlkB [Chitinophaga terrae (ex Kim and Jung 2007)]|jgi:alkylated DNA repair dioxygenase AlkB|uniref:Alkylated DNA repair dioxygenase AlkB n=1 Tax=Chitinophaga terrae (ex Kim and Jung 2007) TaxID=408074 RepID=A0A1H3YTE7_9BACT|nr:alpha-ketoglutarate-dependent dioxygenase AlkB [Chitinophaga terrae (ex Kim and Jung 2007)]GEP88488.1 alkylated DNA repair protein [Chitinophaga terrae (ex Kim and Jung 2007)]SEA14680.1 Alkylated DNA repair dioxygenase AlkB [Chitinophaga terrae (ex Kim and Jung 2007)]
MTQFSLFDDNEHLIFPEGLLTYYPHFLEEAEGIALLNELIDTVPWKQSTLTIQDKVVLTPRLTAWYGDAGRSYRLSDKDFTPNPWTERLLSLKERVEALTHLHFNCVLLNYYRDGNDSVAWHSDHERELGQHPNIASLSVGQARTFEFRNKKDHKRKYALTLGNGSLLIMKGDLQQFWDHRIPKSTRNLRPRINLTFRIIH